MADCVLKTENLVKRYGALTAVKGLSLEVYEGEVFGFLGPNGAGKTTSINMMCGLLRPDHGRVLVRGIPLESGAAETRTRVGMCPQSIVVWERLTCLEQLEFMGRMYGVSGSVARQRSLKLLDDLDLAEKRDKQARTLSGGLQRRLNLALALVHDPEIVVLDEPEAGLDPQSRVRVREYVQGLARRKTVILTTHNMDEADRVVDRVAIIDHGELLELDTPEALKQRAPGGTLIELTLAGTVDGVADAVRGIDGVLRAEPRGQLLRVYSDRGGRVISPVIQAAEEHGLSVTNISLTEPSLETLFVARTGRKLE